MDSTTEILRRATHLLAENPEWKALVDERPTEPLPQDCCGCSCDPCVFDLYHLDLLEWSQFVVMTLESESALKTENKKSNCHQFSMELVSRENITPDVIRCRFGKPAGFELSIRPGQHLIASCRWKDGRQRLSRPLTPINSDSTIDEHLDFIIKIYPHGRMSQLAKNWLPGDVVDWRGPFGREFYEQSKEVAQHWVLICSGVGLAPMIPVIRALLRLEFPPVRLRLIQACRQNSDWFRWWEEGGANAFWTSERFSLGVYFSRQETTEGDPGINCRIAEVHSGRITLDSIKQELDQLNYNTHSETFRFLLCGSNAFTKDMINFLWKSGVCPDEIRKF